MTKSSFEDVIAEQGRLIYTSVGDSMYPLIRQGDLLIISAVSSPLKRFDIPLYKRDSGQYVLHRIIGSDSRGYITCGDNRDFAEHGVTDRHVIGVLTGIIRGGDTLTVEYAPRGLYDRLWFHSILFRKIIFKARRSFK